MIPSKYSVKVVLGLVMVAAGLMLLAVLMPPLYSAITLREAVARTDALVSISNALLHALQTQRRERTTLGTALQADWIIKPDVEAEAKAYRDVTEPSYQQAIAAIPPLDLSGIKPMFDRLIQAHTVLNALRPQVDEAVHRPLAERPAGLAKAWADACLAQLNTLDAVADVVDAAVQLTDAQVDQFLAVKRAAWVARNFFGVELLTGVDGLAAHKPWTAAQIDAAAQARGRATDAWTIVAAVAARSDVPFALKNAFIKTTEDYFGANAKVRQPVTDALLQGRVPDLSGNDYLKLTLPSLANFNDVSTAAVDAMIGRSSQLNRGAWEQIVLCAFELVFSTLLIVSGFMIVLFRVSRPLQSLTDAMGHLARGEYATAVPGLGRGDEIGAMANAVQTFKENGLAMRRMETEAMEQRQLAENERAKTDAQREQAAARLAQVVEGLADGLAQLAAGNLTVSLDATFAPEYDRLRIDFNAAVCGLQAALRDVLLHTEAIGTGTVEIANAADDLARRTEQQAAGLEQTAAALDEVTATVRQTAENSGRAQNVAVVTKAEADRSGKVVDETVAAMSTIEGSARQIGQIIGVIDEIAFQTSLLALNAGVEAARAGEAGRGFAVVAQEVRALAQRAADAAKQIKTLVTNSMLQVERGVRLVGETGNALGRIQAGVVEMDQVIREIAASATEQAQGLAEVNIAVNQMDQTTQQNAAMVEQSTSATHSLAQETNALQKAMSRFRIEPQTPPARSQNLAS